MGEIVLVTGGARSGKSRYAQSRAIAATRSQVSVGEENQPGSTEIRPQEDPIARQSAPNTKHRTPNTKHRTPNTKHRMPNTQDRTPNAEHLILNTQYSTLRVAYIATGQATDDEMQDRIQRHRQDRPADWITIEAPQRVPEAVAEAVDRYDIILLDCLTFFVANLLLATPELEPAAIQVEVAEAASRLCEAARAGRALSIMVTNEVGMGVVPEYPLGRLFRDLAGWVNQQVAAAADEVVLVVCGIPLKIKG